MKGLLGLSLLLPLSFGYFTPHFREYLVTTYGNDTAKELERGDLGEEGSYGGKANSTQALRHKPAVLVHGIGTNAQKWVPLKNYFMKNGYTDAEIYGTTWGDPDENIIFVSVQCTYVRQVRTLIEAAHNYTKWKVDIAGFSLGSVIARKAILGGYCQGEDLGGPLTDIIDTFVSVAGPNRGSAMCEQFTNIDLCNTDNGLACDSSLLYELNNVGHRYEGKFSFAVHSQKDEKIGNWCCGERCGSLPHSQREFGNHQEHHNLLLLRSTRLIYDLFWEDGSFGGRTEAGEAIKHEPVILVHGVMNNAMRFFPVKHLFMTTNNYSEAEIYGTTWGDPDTLLIDVVIHCEYIKQVRNLIQLVHSYTDRKVDVIGYSMGSVISRKAILGGSCDGEDLGRALTEMIDTFVSVAGSNYGSTYCEDYSYMDVCNSVNGLSCDSEILKDINSQKTRYEGRYTFAIASPIDEKIGDDCCGNKCASLPRAAQEFWGLKLNHDKLMLGSGALQIELVTQHRRIKARLNAKMPVTPAPKVDPEAIDWKEGQLPENTHLSISSNAKTPLAHKGTAKPNPLKETKLKKDFDILSTMIGQERANQFAFGFSGGPTDELKVSSGMEKMIRTTNPPRELIETGFENTEVQPSFGRTPEIQSVFGDSGLIGGGGRGPSSEPDDAIHIEGAVQEELSPSPQIEEIAQEGLPEKVVHVDAPREQEGRLDRALASYLIKKNKRRLPKKTAQKLRIVSLHDSEAFAITKPTPTTREPKKYKKLRPQKRNLKKSELAKKRGRRGESKTKEYIRGELKPKEIIRYIDCPAKH
ncbi:unnamed protein product, partial [Mesorhabditis spiculigera]